MRILVLGAGAIGGYFGGRLAESGADVTFLVRARRKAELAARGLIVKSALGDLALPVSTVEAGEIAAPYDLVLLSCKSYDLEAAMAAIAPAMGPTSAVLPLLNGVAHLERLTARFGAAAVMGGACYASVVFEDGVIQHVGALQSLVFGEISGAVTARARHFADILAASKIEGSLSTDIMQAMWDKLVMLAALAATTTLARASVGEIMAAPSGEAFLLGALAECAAVAAAEGHPSGQAALERDRSLLAARGSPFTASMMRDVVAGRPTESDHIIGDLVRRAGRHALDTPILRVALAVLETHEARLKPRA